MEINFNQKNYKNMSNLNGKATHPTTSSKTDRFQGHDYYNVDDLLN